MMSTTTLPATERGLRLAITPIRSVVVRDATGTGDGSWTMEGYAAVFEQETVLYDGNWFRMREVISRDAFTNVLQRVSSGDELVHLNFGHDMNTSVAATDVEGIGSLELSEDMHGLRFFARVDPSDPDAERMAVKMRRGVIRQASFAFTIADEVGTITETEDGRDDELWRINEIGHLYDVCACAQGAYPQTESYVRALAGASLGRTLEVVGHDHRTETVGGSRIAPETVGESESKWQHDRDLRAARVRATNSLIERKHSEHHPDRRP
jgi:HK97 family phage prohead protease